MEIYMCVYVWSWWNIFISVHCCFHTYVSHLDCISYFMAFTVSGSQHRNCENWVFLPVCEIPVIWVQISPQNLSSGFCQIYSSDTGRHTCFFHTAEGKKHSKRITCCFIAEPHRPIKVPQNNSSAHDSGACFLKWPDWVNNFLLQLLICLADKYGTHIVHLGDFNWFDCQEQATARLTLSSALKLW